MTNRTPKRLTVMEDILREMFGPGGRGPQRAARTKNKPVARKRVKTEDPCLLAEQERLAREWGK